MDYKYKLEELRVNIYTNYHLERISYSDDFSHFSSRISNQGITLSMSSRARCNH